MLLYTRQKCEGMRDLPEHLSTESGPVHKPQFFLTWDILYLWFSSLCSFHIPKNIAACELTVKLVLIYFLLQIPLKVPMNTTRVNRPWFEHPSTASILCIGHGYSLQTTKWGKLTAHIAIKIVDMIHSGWSIPEHLCEVPNILINIVLWWRHTSSLLGIRGLKYDA